ncbi:hypothetical protein BUALT_Bualt11G0137100 [Buddleja alternifolia]|uniref:Replication factor A C-terminal domain-containing protein n=1 Tax=Buddleja alternifolia TaxID=168488 RepID=A0AAV6X5P6_9LAMI|nr:hypothetical protein BUALT_Bualt11G0137100 [Buddleja alternifolia]
MARLREIVELKEYISNIGSSNNVPNFPLMNISALLNWSEYGKVKIVAKARVTEFDQRCFYMSCDTCTSATNAELDWEFECTRCRETRVAIPRAKVVLTLYDSSAEIDCLGFGEIAERFIGKPATVLKLKGVYGFLGETNNSLEGDTYSLIIKKMVITRNGIGLDQYIIVDAQSTNNSVLSGEYVDRAVPEGRHEEKNISDSYDDLGDDIHSNVMSLKSNSKGKAIVDDSQCDNDEGDQSFLIIQNDNSPSKTISDDPKVSPSRTARKTARKLFLKDELDDDDVPIMSTFKRKK